MDQNLNHPGITKLNALFVKYLPSLAGRVNFTLAVLRLSNNDLISILQNFTSANKMNSHIGLQPKEEFCIYLKWEMLHCYCINQINILFFGKERDRRVQQTNVEKIVKTFYTVYCSSKYL